jgi:hypothetical protein
MLKIDATQIESIQVIGESKNKVLIVKQINSNRPLVIKSEETTSTNEYGDTMSRNNVGAMLQFHGTLFSQLRSLPFDTERITLNEISALRSVSPNKVAGLNGGETWPGVFDSDVAKQNGRIKAVVKISYVEQLANLNGMAKDLGQIQMIRAGLETGKADFVFELGQILAVDFFIGNHDRFSAEGKLVGPQNIFFSTKNNVISATGIDTYDVFSAWSDLNKTIEDLERGASGTWPGRILAPGAVKQRQSIAEKAMGWILTTAYEGNGGMTGKVGFPTECTIGPSRKKTLVTLFHKGMSEAKSTLRKKYRLSDNMSGLQAGIRSRWNVIRG